MVRCISIVDVEYLCMSVCLFELHVQHYIFFCYFFHIRWSNSMFSFTFRFAFHRFFSLFPFSQIQYFLLPQINVFVYKCKTTKIMGNLYLMHVASLIVPIIPCSHPFFSIVVVAFVVDDDDGGGTMMVASICCRLVSTHYFSCSKMEHEKNWKTNTCLLACMMIFKLNAWKWFELILILHELDREIIFTISAIFSSSFFFRWKQEKNKVAHESKR